MSACAKNILSYWRIPLYFFIAAIVLLVIPTKSETATGIISSLWLFVAAPGFVISFIVTIVRCIKNAIKYKDIGWPEEVTLHEVDFFVNIVNWIKDEVFDISYMPGWMKVRYVIFRVFGIALIIGGIFLALIFAVFGALVIIAGAALCIMANPRTYNKRVKNVRMISCHKGDSIRRIHGYMKNKWTPLGMPCIARIAHVKGEALAWGPNNGGEVVVLYHARFSPCFYVSKAFGADDIEEYLTMPETSDSNLLEEDLYDIDSLIEKIAEVVEINAPRK